MSSHDSEKERNYIDHVEKAQTDDRISASAEDEVEDLDEHAAKKVIAKIDRRLLVTIGFMYCVSLIDRTNISAAAIAGLIQDLELYGNRYVRELYPALRLCLMNCEAHLECFILLCLVYRNPGLLHRLHRLPTYFNHHGP